MAMATLQQLAIPVPAGIAAPTPNALGATRFVAFGDSITWGGISSPDARMLYDGSPSAYAVRLQLGLNARYAPQSFTVINRGLPGEAITFGALNRLRTVLETDRPHALLLLEGINDLTGGVPIPDTIAALRAAIDISLQRNVPVLIATMYQTYESVRPDPPNPPTPRPNAAALVPEFNLRIREIAARQNVTLVDIEAAFANNRSLVGSDGLHPTPEGHHHMADEFMRAIQRAFPIRGSFQ
jgi:lysophospholipase L1-like esterase